MGSLTDFMENAMLNHLCNTAFTPAATLFVALCTADPTDAATGAIMNEVTSPGTNGYARAALAFTNPASSRRVVQSAPVTFPQASASWGNISHWAIVSTSTYGAGDVYAYGSFVNPFNPVAGNTPTIPTSELEVEIRSTQYTATTISAAAADNSLNDSANNFPIYAAGTLLYVSGFTGTPANNGTVTVSSSTSSKIVVTGITYVNDAAGESVTISPGGGYTDFLVHSWLNRMFRNQAFAKPSTYVGLATTVIQDTHVAIGSITEVTGSGYARVLVNANGGASPTWKVSTTGNVDNLAAITWNATGTWPTIESMFLIDTPSGAGNIMAYDNLTIQNQAPISGDTVQFAIGSLDLNLL